jgi:hypothetical protein
MKPAEAKPPNFGSTFGCNQMLTDALFTGFFFNTIYNYDATCSLILFVQKVGERLGAAG